MTPEEHTRLRQHRLTASRAADLLSDSGYKRVYIVVYGYEGEMSDKGRRTVNGWKNSGLPWSYELDKQKMYFPR